MNNIPITSRIQKKTKGGMVKEPLLNLGSPLAQTSTDGDKKKKKKEDKKEATVENYILNADDGSIGSESIAPGANKVVFKPAKEITKAKGDDYDGSGGYASDKDWSKFLKTEKGKAYTANTQEQVGTGKFEPAEETVVQGDPVVKNVTYKKALTGTAKQPWESRFNSRNVKKTHGDVSSSQAKLDRVNRRLGRMKAEDKVVGNRKFDRLSRKVTENTNENKAFKGAAAAATAQSIQGKVAGEKVDLGERNARLSDVKLPGVNQGDFKTQMRSGFKMKGYKK